MKRLLYILLILVSIIIIFILSFFAYINWPIIENQYYTFKADKVGSCYYQYRGKLEFVTGFDSHTISRHPLNEADIDNISIIDIFCDSIVDCFKCAIWAKDNENVFWKAEILSDADPYTFIPLSKSGFSKDHIHVFYKAHNISVANPSEFYLINDEFARDNQFVFFKDKPLTQVKHPESFEILDHYCWRDDELVYLNGVAIENADTKTFELVDSKEYKGKFKFFVYKDKINGYILDLNKDIYQRSVMKDHRKVYVIPDIDFDSFKASKHKYYTFDKNHVYFKDHAIEDVNPKDFNIINQFYSIYDGHVYFKDSIIHAADYNSINVIGHLLARDLKNVFYEGHIIKNVELDKLRVLNDYYLTDGKNVYYKWHLIENADPTSFKIVNEHLKHEAKDKNHLYRKGKIFKKKKVRS